MKRSEILLLINATLQRTIDMCNDYSYDAEEILTKLEEAGMRPSRYLREIPKEEILTPGDIPMGDGKFGVITTGWEDE